MKPGRKPKAWFGRRFGLWTVVADSSHPRKVVCVCVCGELRHVYKSNLTRGLSRQCFSQRHIKTPRKVAA